MQLEDYLRNSAESGVIDHSLRASVGENGQVSFYIHPDGVDGETCDYVVSGNQLSPDPSVGHQTAAR